MPQGMLICTDVHLEHPPLSLHTLRPGAHDLYSEETQTSA